jgi:hypothetical protein
MPATNSPVRRDVPHRRSMSRMNSDERSAISEVDFVEVRAASK